MSNASVRAALESRLANWAAARSPALTVVWQNVPANPAQGQTYLRAFLLPADTQSEDLEGLHRARLGVFQVSIVLPINVGPGAADGIADELNTLFPVNGRYTAGSVTTQIITPASPSSGFQDEATFIVPVSIGYRADTI